MPTNYSGNPGNITTPLAATVVSCTSGAGGVVVVQTSAAHMFATYDYVSVTGVTGTTEANITAEIVVLSSTTFSLDGTTFVHAYSTGGTAEDLSLTPYFQLPNDGEAATAETIESSIQCIADRTQYLQHMQLATGNTVEYLASGTWVCPNNVTSVVVSGCGGGGGGATGWSQAGLASGTRAPGGGAGGAARFGQCTIAVTPGTTYTIHVGAGGAGGAGGAPGTVQLGFPGEDTTFGSLARLKGGGGGTYGAAGSIVIGAKQSTGGMPVNDMTVFNSRTIPIYDGDWTDDTNQANIWPIQPGQGGASLAYGGALFSSDGQSGAPSPVQFGNFTGGAGGGHAADSGIYCAGSGGGGGGGGPYGTGGAGGDGGNANNSGTGSSGNSGFDAPANSGAGGGGSGAPGYGSAANGFGAGLAGAGGSGRLYVTRNG